MLAKFFDKIGIMNKKKNKLRLLHPVGFIVIIFGIFYVGVTKIINFFRELWRCDITLW